VGDTYPVGCRYSDKVVFPEFFEGHPDLFNVRYQTETGVYEASEGPDSVHLSWGHEEYIYSVVKDGLPGGALSMHRFHTFYEDMIARYLPQTLRF